jgi:hypothetical protein
MVGSDGLKAAVGVLGCEVLALLSIGVGKHTAAVDGLSSSRASTDSRLSNSEDRLRHEWSPLYMSYSAVSFSFSISARRLYQSPIFDSHLAQVRSGHLGVRRVRGSRGSKRWYSREVTAKVSHYNRIEGHKKTLRGSETPLNKYCTELAQIARLGL